MQEPDPAGLFPWLLGAQFALLGAPVQAVHDGRAGRWLGRASVWRGANPMARLACVLAGLPPDCRDVPLQVDIEPRAGTERWTRRYGDFAPMVSTLGAARGQLVERLGPAVNTMQLSVDDGALRWRGTHMRLLGLPLPRSAFAIDAKVWGEGGVYQFEVSARLAVIGELIRYRGFLHV